MIDLHTYSLIIVIQWDTYFDLEEYEKVSRTLRDQMLSRIVFSIDICCVIILFTSLFTSLQYLYNNKAAQAPPPPKKTPNQNKTK